MTDDYSMAKPNPFLRAGDELEPVRDLTGFRPGVDRMKTAPEFLADSRMSWLEPGRYVIDANGRVTPDQPITEETSDGYHTFRELYDHRRALTAALLRTAVDNDVVDLGSAWRSRSHHPLDSACYPGYFVVGLTLSGYPITYHYADQFWDDFRHVPELEHAPRWDGADPSATVTRLIDYARG